MLKFEAFNLNTSSLQLFTEDQLGW